MTHKTIKGYNLSVRGAAPEPCNYVAYMALFVMPREEYDKLHFAGSTPAYMVGAEGQTIPVHGCRISGNTLDDIVAVITQNAKNAKQAIEQTNPMTCGV